MKPNYYTRKAALIPVTLATLAFVPMAKADTLPGNEGMDMGQVAEGIIYNMLTIPVNSLNRSTWTTPGSGYPQFVAPVSQFTGINNDGSLVDLRDLIPLRSTSYIWVDPTTGIATHLPVAANNGLTKNDKTIQLGGSLVQSTAITQGNNNLIFDQNGSGRIGIDTFTPLTTFHAHTDDPFSGIAMSGRYPRYTVIDTNYGTPSTAPVWGIDSNGGYFRIFRQQNLYTTGYAHFRIDPNGDVAIGAGTPSDSLYSKGRLHVGVASNHLYGTGSDTYFFASSDLGKEYSVVNKDLQFPSIVADSSIITQGSMIAFNGSLVYSDSRFKKVVGISDRSKDLDLLNRIKVTDYTYIDRIASGAQVHKKVIAQEVEEVLPAAVKKRTEFVPEIFAKASKVAADGGGRYTITLDKSHSLKKGDRIRLFDEKNERIETTVAAAERSTFSVVTDKNLGKGVFVYGAERNDVRAVDYEAIAMLNVSATQELARKVSALEAENAELKKITAKVEKMEALISALEGKSNGTVTVSLGK